MTDANDDMPQEIDLGDLDDEQADTISCPACGQEIYAQAQQCPACGEYVVAGSGNRSNRKWRWIVVAVLCVALACYLVAC